MSSPKCTTEEQQISPPTEVPQDEPAEPCKNWPFILETSLGILIDAIRDFHEAQHSPQVSRLASGSDASRGGTAREVIEAYRFFYDSFLKDLEEWAPSQTDAAPNTPPLPQYWFTETFPESYIWYIPERSENHTWTRGDLDNLHRLLSTPWDLERSEWPHVHRLEMQLREYYGYQDCPGTPTGSSPLEEDSDDEDEPNEDTTHLWEDKWHEAIDPLAPDLKEDLCGLANMIEHRKTQLESYISAVEDIRDSVAGLIAASLQASLEVAATQQTQSGIDFTTGGIPSHEPSQSEEDCDFPMEMI